jgi:hypothetical protein
MARIRFQLGYNENAKRKYKTKIQIETGDPRDGVVWSDRRNSGGPESGEVADNKGISEKHI